MAGDNQDSATVETAANPRSYSPSSRTQTLRTIAQSHLNTIEVEDTAETQRQAMAQQDLQKYAKVRRKDRPKVRTASPPTATSNDTNTTATSLPLSRPHSHPRGSESDSVEKKPKFRPAQDILSRLQHDPTFEPHLSEYHIGYLERFEGIKEMPARSWIGESTDEEWIPMHRVKYVVRISNGVREVVWDRERRVDLIFGSGQTASQRSRYGDENEVEEEQSEAGGVIV